MGRLWCAFRPQPPLSGQLPIVQRFTSLPDTLSCRSASDDSPSPLPFGSRGFGTDTKTTAKTISEETISTLRSRRASWQSRWMSLVIFGWVSISYLAEVASSTYLWTSLGFSTSKESLSSGSMSPTKFHPTGWHEEYSFPPPDVIVGGTRNSQKNTANAAKATTLRVIR